MMLLVLTLFAHYHSPSSTLFRVSGFIKNTSARDCGQDFLHQGTEVLSHLTREFFAAVEEVLV